MLFFLVAFADSVVLLFYFALLVLLGLRIPLSHVDIIRVERLLPHPATIDLLLLRQLGAQISQHSAVRMPWDVTIRVFSNLIIN